MIIIITIIIITIIIIIIIIIITTIIIIIIIIIIINGILKTIQFLVHFMVSLVFLNHNVKPQSLLIILISNDVVSKSVSLRLHSPSHDCNHSKL